MKHEYIVRETGEIARERLVGDRTVCALYSRKLENAKWVSKLASSRKVSELLAYLNYDHGLASRAAGMKRFLRKSGVDLSELLDDPAAMNTTRKLFERKIRYWECRPLPALSRCALCPSDSRAATGAVRETPKLLIKEKFFSFPELLGGVRNRWTSQFTNGDYSIFRLTPEKYHYTHVPVSGVIKDFYAVDGRYHSCNPNATARLAAHSKNKRVVTILDSDVPGGTGVGLVAMVEVVALMIGQIEQCYSEHEYDDPKRIEAGMFLHMGAPKALFRPGSSTVVLLFERDRIRFANDLLRNQKRCDVSSRYSRAFGEALVETEVKCRSLLAVPADRSTRV